MKPFVLLLSIILSISCANKKEKQNDIKEGFETVNNKLDKKLSDVNKTSSELALKEDTTSVKKELITEVVEEKTFLKEKETNKVKPNNGKKEITYPKKIEKVQQETVLPQDTSKEVVEVTSSINHKENNKIVANTEPTPQPKVTSTEIKSTTVAVSNKTWETLLKRHVDSKGNVNYAAFKKEEKILASYLDFLANSEPGKNNSKNEKLAYYINLYNAATVKLILNHYPTKSIKDIKSPWDKKWIKIGSDVLSLGYIEHKILRKMNEPRIHFAINCASYSCPQLLNTPFTAANMEQKLEKATKGFINDTSRNKFGEKISLSRIFKWYKNDFTDNGSLLEYIKPYANTEIDTNSKIIYLTYDWSLNEKK